MCVAGQSAAPALWRAAGTRRIRHTAQKGQTGMARTETNDPETQYSDAPGTRALTKGSVAIVVALITGLIAFILAAFGLLPALVLLVVAIPLGVWGKNKLAANQQQIGPQS
jgi:hypothetical protein